ncbi:organic cation transporter protein [Aplysia californica]|uniref:Organic cation transporter protein n=1 Tax=Aplysia californica TaxID=6500 RepID=A0ABM1VTP5_APLCA|nr:organic cation transporter protein [Aplysia californica]
MKFDDVLEHHVGEFGPYQKWIYFLACIPAVAGAFMSLMPVFILAKPDFRCKLPFIENDTYHFQSEYHERLVNASVPIDTNIFGELQFAECQLFDHGNASANGILNSSLSSNSSRTFCDDWVYDNSVHITAISDYDMVCENEILVSHFKMIAFIGGLIGAFVNGILSDLFGRKRVFLCCLAFYTLATVVLIFSPNYLVFLAMRFFQGVFGSGVFMISFVYVMEVVGPHYRMFAGMFIEVFWCLGLFLLVGAAYFIRNWTHLLLVLSAPCVLLFSYIWILPESPRWLFSVGKIKEAEAVLRRTAKVNGTELPEKLLEQVESENQKEGKQKKETGQVWKIVMYRVVLIRTLVVIFNRFALNMCYYGISLNVEHLSGNLYLSYTLSSVVETVAIIVILCFIKKFGRKPLYCCSMMLGSLGFLLSAFPIYLGSESDQKYSLGLVMVGKFGTSAAFAVMYVYGCELFPTSIRNSAMGISFVVELLGGVVSPYIVDLGKLIGAESAAAFPMLVFGAVSFAAALLSLVLPETRNRQLPETVEDAVRFGHLDIL